MTTRHQHQAETSDQLEPGAPDGKLASVDGYEVTIESYSEAVPGELGRGPQVTEPTEMAAAAEAWPVPQAADYLEFADTAPAPPPARTAALELMPPSRASQVLAPSPVALRGRPAYAAGLEARLQEAA